MAKNRRKDPTEDASEGTGLVDYIIPQKVEAFVAYWQPSDARMASEKFGEIKLREFFKAYPCSLGDPLAIYLNLLEQHGFKLQVDFGMNEPVLYVCERFSGGLLDITEV